MNVRSLGPLHQLLGPNWSVVVREDAAWFGTRDRWIVHIEQGLARVRASGEARDNWVEAPLDGDLREVVRHARWWRERLTIHRLQAGERYQALRDFDDLWGTHFGRGEVLEFTELEYIPRDDCYVLHFGPKAMWMRGDDDLCADFDLYVG